MINDLVESFRYACALIKATPIERPRPNEVGNDIELFIIEGLKQQGLTATRPLTRSGRGQCAGYPDIEIQDRQGRPSYLECRIYSERTRDTSMRSFYLSPSADFKVTKDARHLLIALQMQAARNRVGEKMRFIPTAFKLVDLHGLDCDLKFEFNSDNRRLCEEGRVLAEETL